jgi:hypothetical protein
MLDTPAPIHCQKMNLARELHVEAIILLISVIPSAVEDYQIVYLVTLPRGSTPITRVIPN